HARAEAVLAFEGREEVGHEIDHVLEGILIHLAAAEALGDGDDTDGQRGPGGNAVLRLDTVRHGAAPAVAPPVEVEPDELRGSAADVEHEDEVAVLVDQRGAARDREARLRLAADNLDL